MVVWCSKYWERDKKLKELPKKIKRGISERQDFFCHAQASSPKARQTHQNEDRNFSLEEI